MMDLTLVLKAAAALSVIGLVTSAILATAAKRFHVETDPRIEQILSALPGSNCGACGNPSCFVAAEEIAAGDIPPTSCTAGGQSTAEAVSSIVGADVCVMETVLSVRHCGGGTNAQRTHVYSGIPTCAAADRLAGGGLACAWGCLGYGDCVKACPFDALALDERGLPVVDLGACTGCGICVRECPRGRSHLLELVPEMAPVVVRCAAHDRVKERKAGCSMSCIACKKCERECPEGAIAVVDMLAVIDYEKCTGCGVCVSVCPQNCIDLFGRGSSAWRAADGAGVRAVSDPSATAVGES